MILSEPCRELREIPQLAKKDSQLEQAVLVQRERRTAVWHAWIETERRRALHGEVVGGDRGYAGIRDPLEQFLVVAIQHRARRLKGRTRFSGGVADELPEAGVDAQHVAFLH